MPTDDEIKAALQRIESLEATVRRMQALARGPKGEDGRDGKDGKDGRDGRIVKSTDNATPGVGPVVNVKYEPRSPTAWEFETIGKKTIARPLEDTK